MTKILRSATYVGSGGIAAGLIIAYYGGIGAVLASVSVLIGIGVGLWAGSRVLPAKRTRAAGRIMRIGGLTVAVAALAVVLGGFAGGGFFLVDALFLGGAGLTIYAFALSAVGALSG